MPIWIMVIFLLCFSAMPIRSAIADNTSPPATDTGTNNNTATATAAASNSNGNSSGNSNGHSDSTTSGNFDSIYGGGNDELDKVRFSDSYIHMKIENDMKLACDRTGTCTLFAISNSGSSFTASFGMGWSSGGTTGGYGYGGYGTTGTTGTTGTAGTVGSYGSYGSTAAAGPFVGINLIYNSYHCIQKINVPRSLYVSMNTYLYRLMNEDGTPRRSFTPADETMIMFYTTIMKQATGCTAATGRSY
ncbi:MAG: hypothetical protein HQK51_06830 [Oligoflexia bacterium]|nr:hypothetical protein [Oligoflexia bacterium]